MAFVDGVGGNLLSVHCKRTRTEQKHSGLGQGSCPGPDEGRGLLVRAGPAGWLPESSGVRSRRLVAAAAQWDTRPRQPQGFGGAAGLALCRDCAENSPPSGGKQINLLRGNLSLDRFSLRRIHSDLCPSGVAFCLGPLTVKAAPCCHGLLLREASELCLV